MGSEQPLKTFKFGMEFEVFTLNEKGYVINAADRLINRVKKSNPEIGICKEVGKNMVEFSSLAHPDVTNVMEKMMGDFEKILYAAQKEGIVIYPLGTYPGAFTPKMRTEERYRIKEKIFGKTRFLIAARCVGLHCHYTLPWGVFDVKRKRIRKLINSKNKESMVNLYNLFIAMDPALTTFAQSSPFYQGKFLGKDSRVIVYRGGKVLNYPQGLYANYQNFGMLQPYKYTGTDLLQIIDSRFKDWAAMAENLGMNIKTLLKHGSILDTTWNPVKINSHGTMEQRGMDMNYPRIVVAVALIIKYVSKEVQEKFLKVEPSDIALTEPFKMENSTIYIPPHTHVRFELQPRAAYTGLEDDSVLAYCQGLLKLAKECVPENRKKFLAPLEEMLKARKTVSDKILEDAKKMGAEISKGLTKAQAAELALKYAKHLFEDIIMTKQALHELGNGGD